MQLVPPSLIKTGNVVQVLEIIQAIREEAAEKAENFQQQLFADVNLRQTTYSGVAHEVYLFLSWVCSRGFERNNTFTGNSKFRGL